MEQLTKNRSAVTLVVALLFLLLFAVYMYLLKPASDKVSSQEEELSRLDTQISVITKKLEENKLSTGEMTEAQIQEALPLWDNIEQLLLDLRSIQTQTNAKTTSLSFTTENDNSSDTEAINTDDPNLSLLPSSGAKKVSVSTVVKGSYAAVLNYIDALQKMPRLITINTFDVSKAFTVSGAPAEISASLTFTAYYDPSYRSMVEDVLEPYPEYATEDKLGTDQSSTTSDTVDAPAKTQDATIGKIVENVEQASQ